MVKRRDIPNFGLLKDVRVVVAAVSVAAPFAGQLFAENGADVIWLESPKGVDIYRWTNDGWGVENEHRNMRNIMVDVVQPEGREILLKLLEETDILIEASRGGQWEKWGLTDEVLWKINPRLVIGHISGYGLSGDPEYVSRPGYDHTIGAFSGLMYLNGYEDGSPLYPQKFITDYQVGLFAYGSALAAYIGVLKTGKGESFDLAQFEASVRCQAAQFCLWFDKHYQVPRGFGSSSGTIAAGTGYYECKDGEGVYLFPNGRTPLKKTIEFFGFEYGSTDYPEGIPVIDFNSSGGPAFNDAVLAFCAQHTAQEVEDAISGIGVPCSKVLSYADMEHHPHYLARNTWVEWENVKGKTIKGSTAVPRYKNNPSQIWRGCPSQGMDNEDILEELGFSDRSYIESLYAKGILKKTDYVGGE